MSTPLRILLADDHQILREGLRHLLEKAGMNVVAEAENGRSAVQVAATLSPDIVVIDIRMPDMNGIDATRRMIEQNPSIKIIGLSAYADERTTSEMLRAGAKGYLPKDSAL